MRRTVLLYTSLLLALPLAACSEVTTSLDPRNQYDSILGEFLTASEPTAIAEGVALGLALAMSERAFQEGVRNVLKESDYVEHKIEVSSFLVTDLGSEFVRRTASRIGITAADLSDRLANLGSLDFYVPRQEKRESWRPGQPLAVGFAPDEDDTRVKSYLPSGQSIMVTAEGLGASPITLFVLHPAEPKALRYEYQVRRTGDAIQEIGEPNIGGFDHEVGPDGSLRRIEFADLPPEDRPMVRVRLRGELTTSTAKLLAGDLQQVAYDLTPGSLINWDSPVEGDGVGDCEIYMRQEFYTGPGTSYIEKTRYPASGHIGGLPCGGEFGSIFGYWVWDWFYQNEFGIKVLSNGMGSFYNHIRRKLIEDDQFNDDDWGVNQYGYPNWDRDTCYYGYASGDVGAYENASECTFGQVGVTAEADWNGTMWSSN